MKLTAWILLSTFLLTGSSCSLVKKLSKAKTTTQTSEISEITTNRRIQLNEEWAQIGSSIVHSDGVTWIEFDSLTRIDISPTNQITAVGYNPTLRSSTSYTRRDTSATLGKIAVQFSQDSSGRTHKESTKVEKTLDRSKDKQSQKIAPILVLSILLIIALLYTAKRFKLF